MSVYGHHWNRFDLVGCLVLASESRAMVGRFGVSVADWLLVQHKVVLSPFPRCGDQYQHDEADAEHRQNWPLSILAKPDVSELRWRLFGAVAVGEFDPHVDADASLYVVDHAVDHPARRILS